VNKLAGNKTIEKGVTKTELALSLGLSRQALYYKPKKPAKDLAMKIEIERVLSDHPAYGHKRIALELGLNKKRIRRIMKKFGLKPYKRRVKRPKKEDDLNKPSAIYRNLIKTFCPIKPNILWVADFTYIRVQARFIYLATVMDLFTREILGWSISGKHDRFLVLEALNMAFLRTGTMPLYHHSDQGSEYDSYDYIKKLESNRIAISMSQKSHPWENGYQESFYSQFKVDLGMPDQYETWGELIEAIHLQINYYNKSRIHTSLKTSPVKFREQYYLKSLTISNTPRQRQLV
jgi:transposase InsO family protein